MTKSVMSNLFPKQEINKIFRFVFFVDVLLVSYKTQSLHFDENIFQLCILKLQDPF